MRTALTRPPGPAIVRCELTHLERRPIDAAAASAEHSALEQALAGLGCTVVRLPPMPEQPDAAFVEDIAVVLDEVAIITRPGAPSRRAETAGLEAALAPFRPVVRIEAGTLDGGDVLRRGRTLYVGRSSRTDADGIAALRSAAEPRHYRVVPIDVRGCLHLRTAACAIDEDTLLVNPSWVDAHGLGGGAILEVAAGEPFAANVLRVGNTVLTAAGNPRTRERIEALGHVVRTTPLHELGKAEAGVTCCSILIEG